MIKAIFFDWFNTLAYYEPPREELHSQLLGEFGIKVSPPKLMPGLLAADKYFFDETAHSPVNKRNPEGKTEFYIRYANIMLSEVGVKADKKLVLQIIKKWPQLLSQAHFALFDDVLVTLKTLKESKLILGLLTNATRNIISMHCKLDLEPYLDLIITSDEVGADKPSPLIFQAALQQTGVAASEAVHVGDQYKLDVIGAREVGINPILIDRYDLSPAVKDCPRIHSLTELAEYL